MPELYQELKVSRAISVTNGAAGSTDVAGAGLDMAGFEGVIAFVTLGALTTGGTCTLKWQQSSDDGSSDAYSDLEGTLITVNVDADDEKVVKMGLHKPVKRYVRIYNDRATQNSVCSAFYLQYGARTIPVTDESTTVLGESHVSPAEGTA